MKLLQRLLYFVFLLDISSSARILCVFPIPFYSHQKVLRVLPEELAIQGHEVVIITPEPTGVLKENITEIDVREVSYAKWNKIFVDEAKYLKTFATSPTKFVELAFNTGYLIAEAQLNHPDVHKVINNDHKRFDLILAEDCSRAAVIYGAKFQVPIVLVSSFFALHESFQHVGSETNLLLLPYLQKSPESFWERISSFLEAIKIEFILSNLRLLDNYLVEKYFGKFKPSVEEIRKNVKMVFLGMQHMWDSNRAVGPAVNYMGAIHLDKLRPLPQDLQSYLDNSKNGVVYMSLGSKIKSSDLPPHVITLILKDFATLPYDVLWKWNGEELPNKPKNVRLEKWLPQADLLRYPSVKLFITQGGLQSTDEAVTAGVPLLGLPVLADQYQNIQKYKEYGIGTGMDIDSLNEEEFRKVIMQVAENETYRKNIRRLSRILSDQRIDGLQRALHQIQYLLDHGFPLQSPAANISFTEYFMLDVFGPIALVVAIVTVALGSALQRFLQPKDLHKIRRASMYNVVFD